MNSERWTKKVRRNNIHPLPRKETKKDISVPRVKDITVARVKDLLTNHRKGGMDRIKGCVKNKCFNRIKKSIVGEENTCIVLTVVRQ